MTLIGTPNKRRGDNMFNTDIPNWIAILASRCKECAHAIIAYAKSPTFNPQKRWAAVSPAMSSTLRALQSRCKSPGHRNQGYLRKNDRNALSAGKSAGGALACWRERFSREQAASHHGHVRGSL